MAILTIALIQDKLIFTQKQQKRQQNTIDKPTDMVWIQGFQMKIYSTLHVKFLRTQMMMPQRNRYVSEKN
jgi:hypothetical protein